MFIVQIAGRLGKDPETRFTPSGQKVTTFNLATNHRKGKEEVTVWVRVTVWGERLDKIISYLKKGSAAVVIGRMSPPSSYTDREGRQQFSLEVVAEMIEFSPFGKDQTETNQNSYSQESSNQEEPAYSGNSGGYAKNNYGYQTVVGQASSNSQSDDDTLPF